MERELKWVAVLFDPKTETSRELSWPANEFETTKEFLRHLKKKFPQERVVHTGVSGGDIV